MKKDVLEFRNSIYEKKLSYDQLVDLCVSLKEDNIKQENELDEFRKTSKAMSNDYEKAIKARDEAVDAKDKAEAALKSTLEKYELLRRDRFGTKSEKLDNIKNGEPEENADPLEESGSSSEDADSSEKPGSSSDDAGNNSGRTEKGTKSFAGKHGVKSKNARKDNDDSLPHINTFEYNEEALNQLYGEYNWAISFWNVKKQYEVIPESIYVHEIYTPIISVISEQTIKRIPCKTKFLPGVFASASLVADILYKKYVLAQPFYRISMDYELKGFQLSRQTMDSWLLNIVPLLLGVVYDYMISQYKINTYYHQCDETTTEVINDGRKAGSKSFVWVHTTSQLCDGPRYVIFCFELTRGSDHLISFYKGCSHQVFLSCDAYSAYRTLEAAIEEITLSGCNMHSRRRFSNSLVVRDKKGLTDEDIEALPEVKALSMFRDIYKAEGEFTGDTADERREYRQSVVKPNVVAFYEYIETIDLEAPDMPEKLRDAVTYALNQKEYLSRFLDDGNIPIDNGFCERCIRPYAIGRNNWLFNTSVEGAEAGCIVYTMVNTARANEANPYFYLRYLLEEMAKHMKDMHYEFLADLMPWSEAYKAYEIKAKSELINSCIPKGAESPPKTPRKKDKIESDMIA